jgi:hypothetical protein
MLVDDVINGCCQADPNDVLIRAAKSNAKLNESISNSNQSLFNGQLEATDDQHAKILGFYSHGVLQCIIPVSFKFPEFMKNYFEIYSFINQIWKREIVKSGVLSIFLGFAATLLFDRNFYE